VEDGVVAAVDLVAAVDIGTNQIPATRARTKQLRLMGAGVCAEQGGRVDVVGVGAGAARVVGGESERVKVLKGGDDGVEGVVVFVGWGRENGLDDLAGDGDGVVFLKVEFAGGEREDGGGDVVPRVGGVGLAVDLDIFGGLGRGKW
jgi:hypothetical protein